MIREYILSVMFFSTVVACSFDKVNNDIATIAEATEKNVTPETCPYSLHNNMKSGPKDETSGLIETLVGSADEFAVRDTAQRLGDMFIDGKLTVPDAQKSFLDKVIKKYVGQAKSDDPDVCAEARQQIERLWKLSVPVLYEKLFDEDPAVAELAAKSLILMRDRKIIEKIITCAKNAKNANDEDKLDTAVFVLKHMKEQRRSAIPNRKCMSPEESEKLYNELIVPALQELE